VIRRGRAGSYAIWPTANRAARRKLGTALHDFRKVAYQDDWPAIRAALEADIARRTWDLATQGLDYVLRNLHPQVTWDNATLSLRNKRGYCRLGLNGQGLVLVPTIGRPRTFLTTSAEGAPTVLAYPALAEVGPEFQRGHLESLGAVLGRTRAAVLLALSDAHELTTTQLAATCRISLASASEQAKTLRQAGLITSTRGSGVVIHSLTRLGALLAAS
jgi:DNA-binding transcriptional ArsR family regulator